MALSPASIHKELLEDPRKAFAQTREGELVTMGQFLATTHVCWQTHIYAGSFNPLHDGHKAIYEKMPKYEVFRLFEMSINRFDKAPVTEQEMTDRLRQFIGYAPVMITNVSKFIEKAGLCRSYPTTYFHVGADTLVRIMEHNTILEVEGMACEFVFYDRIMDGVKIMELPAVLPRNCKRGKTLTTPEMSMSSTAIRNANLTPLSSGIKMET